MREPIELPADALVLLVGPAGAGKSTFAAHRFAPTEILSSDVFRALVSNDATDQSATADAFRLLHGVARARLRRGLMTVIDATNVLHASRAPMLAAAARHGRPSVAIVLDVPLAVCLERNASRQDRPPVPPAIVRRHHDVLRRAVGHLGDEGFHAVVILGADDPLEIRIVRAG